MLVVGKVGKGVVTSIGAPDTKQAYAYVPDWARAAVGLAEMRMKLDAFEDVPFPGHSLSTREIRDELAEALGREIKIARFPWWSTALLAPFWEMIREFRKMRYLFETSHALSSARFDRLLPDFQHTDLRSVLLSGLAPDVHPNEVVRPGSAAFAAE